MNRPTNADGTPYTDYQMRLMRGIRPIFAKYWIVLKLACLVSLVINILPAIWYGLAEFCKVYAEGTVTAWNELVRKD